MSRKKESVSTLAVPTDFFYFFVIRAYINEIGRAASLVEKDRDGMVLAVSEACANVIEHAFSPKESAAFEVICTITSIDLQVIIKDKGLPFEPGQVERFSIDKVIKGGQPKGLGLFLMEKNVDRLSYCNLGFGGKEVHLIKYLDQRQDESPLEESEHRAYQESLSPSKEPDKKIPYHIALMDPSQAIEISRCAYRTYGYNYISEFIYFPERIVEMNKGGQLISAVAINDRTNKVMSHAALEACDNEGIMELGVAFTKPEFRHQGCLNSLAEYLIEKAHEKGVIGLCARAVTTHPFSQKAILKYGFRNCGIYLGLAPPALFEKYIKDTSCRESILMMYRAIGGDPIPPIYAPDKHMDMIDKIYKNLGLSVDWLELNKRPNIRAVRRASIIDTKVNNVLSSAKIYIKEYAENTVQDVSNILNGLCKQRIETITLYLDLRDQETAFHVEEFEKMGFFFSGILPSKGRQDLILQYLNNLSISYDKIYAETDFAKEIVSYVKGFDLK